MTNPKLDQMREGIEAEIKTVDAALTTLRTQKAALQEQIRVKVAEQTELRSALARMTPRQRKPKETPGSVQRTEPDEID